MDFQKSVGSLTTKVVSIKTKKSRALWQGINEIVYSKRAHKYHILYISRKLGYNKHVQMAEQFKYNLKVFDDFKSKQQGYMKQCFLIRKNIYILKVYPIHYTLR